MSELILECREVGFAYGGRPALRGVDFKARRGALLGVIGPNGSGKSTLAKLIGRALSGYGGSIRLEGAEIAAIPPRQYARRVALAPQRTEIVFPFSAAETVMLGRSPHQGGLGFAGREDCRAVEEAMASMGVEALADRPLTALSGGELQRVVIARALAAEPDLLVLDEPTAALDIRYQSQVFYLLSRLTRKENRAAIVILHDLNQASAFCDEITVLRDGQVAANGAPGAVLTPELLVEVYQAQAAFEYTRDGRPFILPNPNPA